MTSDRVRQNCNRARGVATIRSSDVTVRRVGADAPKHVIAQVFASGTRGGTIMRVAAMCRSLVELCVCVRLCQGMQSAGVRAYDLTSSTSLAAVMPFASKTSGPGAERPK